MAPKASSVKCESSQNTAADGRKLATELFKIVLNPALTKIDVTVGEEVSVHGIVMQVDMRPEDDKAVIDAVAPPVTALYLPHTLVNETR